MASVYTLNKPYVSWVRCGSKNSRETHHGSTIICQSMLRPFLEYQWNSSTATNASISNCSPFPSPDATHSVTECWPFLQLSPGKVQNLQPSRWSTPFRMPPCSSQTWSLVQENQRDMHTLKHLYHLLATQSGVEGKGGERGESQCLVIMRHQWLKQRMWPVEKWKWSKLQKTVFRSLLIWDVCVCVCVCVCVGSVLRLGVAVIFIIRGMPPPRSTPPSTGYSWGNGWRRDDKGTRKSLTSFYRYRKRRESNKKVRHIYIYMYMCQTLASPQWTWSIRCLVNLWLPLPVQQLYN